MVRLFPLFRLEFDELALMSSELVMEEGRVNEKLCKIVMEET